MSKEEVEMSPEEQRKFVRYLCRGKEWLQKQPTFWKSPSLKGLYVSLLTLEGAIMFGDVPEVAEKLTEFCKEKSAVMRVLDN